jgi:signal transduction histidine kinase
MKFRPFNASAARLAAAYFLVFAIGVSLLLAAVYLLTKTELQSEADSVIEAELEGLIDEYRLDGRAGLVEVLNLRSDSWGRTGAVYWLSDAQLNRIAGNLTGWPFAGRPTAKWVEFDLLAEEDEETVRHPVRAQIYPLDRGDLLLVGTDVSEQQRFFTRLRTALVWRISLITLFAALVGFIYVRRVGARVRATAESCETIMAGDLSRRLPMEGSNDEFDQLALAVNHMLDRLEQQSTTLRATFDSTAHDLRAPLHRISMRLEEQLREPQLSAAARENLQSMLEEIARLQRTLGTLLQIAMADAGSLAQQAERVDLGQLARELAELYEPETQARELELAVQVEAAYVQGNRQLLAQLVVNLLENALKYVPAGGKLALTVRSVGQHVRFTMADDGPGIPAAERRHVLEPFVRLDRDSAVTGSGLGLSLVAAIVRLHRGTLSLGDNSPGLRVDCEFPRA